MSLIDLPFFKRAGSLKSPFSATVAIIADTSRALEIHRSWRDIPTFPENTVGIECAKVLAMSPSPIYIGAPPKVTIRARPVLRSRDT